MIEHHTDPRTEENVVRRIKRAYVLALSIIAVTTLSMSAIEHMVMKKFEESTAILNTVNEQRTLIQNIALFSSDVLTAGDRMVQMMAESNTENRKASMVAAHEELLARMERMQGAGRLSPEIHALFHDTPHKLDAKFRRYAEKIDTFLTSGEKDLRKNYNAIYFQAVGPLGSSLDAAVEEIEDHAMKDIAEAQRLRLVLMSVVMVVLVGEWLLIFRPLVRTVEQKTRALAETRDELAHAASHDSLTDLPNRRMLDRMLGTMVAQSRRLGKPLTVCHVDLDRFKDVNDMLGHAAGDRVLVHAATVLRRATRDSDFIARVGGDEFIIVDCTFGGHEGATVMAERIVERMARPFEIEGHLCRIGASIGIAVCDSDENDAGLAMRRADIALYYAKEMGRGQAQLYSTVAQKAFDCRAGRGAA